MDTSPWQHGFTHRKLSQYTNASSHPQSHFSPAVCISTYLPVFVFVPTLLQTMPSTSEELTEEKDVGGLLRAALEVVRGNFSSERSLEASMTLYCLSASQPARACLQPQ